MWADIGGSTEAELDAGDPVYARWLRANLRAGKLVAWIAEVRGDPAASGALWIQRVQPRPRHPTGDTPYLLSMYTEPAHRGKGHARRIVQAAIRWSRAQGYPRMTLHASEMGRPLYEKLGFTRTWEMKLDLKPRAPGRSRHAGPSLRPRRSRSA